MDKLAGCLKIFLEKHLIPSVIASTSTIIIILLENNNWMVFKLAHTLIAILFFCIYFLVVELVLEIELFIRKYKEEIEDGKCHANEQRFDNLLRNLSTIISIQQTGWVVFNYTEDFKK